MLGQELDSVILMGPSNSVYSDSINFSIHCPWYCSCRHFPSPAVVRLGVCWSKSDLILKLHWILCVWGGCGCFYCSLPWKLFLVCPSG